MKYDNDTHSLIVSWKKYKVFPRNHTMTGLEINRFKKRWMSSDFKVDRKNILRFDNGLYKFIFIKPNDKNNIIKELYDKYLFTGIQKFYDTVRQKGYIGISRNDITDFLRNQTNHQLIFNKNKKKVANHIHYSKSYSQFQVDLIDLNAYNHRHYRYILNLQDEFSRKIWIAKLTKKDLTSVQEALSKILDSIDENKRPKTILSDKGSEFIFSNSFKEKYSLKQKRNSSYTPLPLVESTNNVIRKYIRKELINQKNTNWTTTLEKVQYSYNNQFIQKIGIPNKIFEDPNTKLSLNIDDKTKTELLNIGDTVRILLSFIDTRIRERIKAHNNKQTSILYSVVKFTIHKVRKNDTYALLNQHGDIFGTPDGKIKWFPRYSLQKINPNSQDILTIAEADKINLF